MITDFLSCHFGRNNFTAYPPVHHTDSKVCSQSGSPQVHNSAYLLIHSPHSQLDPPKVYKVYNCLQSSIINLQTFGPVREISVH